MTKLTNVRKELRECKRKLKETEGELQSERKKSKQLETQVATGVKFSPIRSKIALPLPNSAELFADKKFSMYSSAVSVAGFRWELSAQRKQTVDWNGKETENGDWLGLFLHLCPPQDYQGLFEFDVSMSFRLLNVFFDKDINKEVTKEFKRNDPIWNNWGLPKFIEIEKLPNDFVQADGSIQLEVHFTVEVITLNQLLPGAGVNGNGNGNNQQNGGK